MSEYQMSARNTIVVIGATGRQGGAVARQLLRCGWRVRAMTRHPEGDAAQLLRDLGAEVVKGDLDSRSSLDCVLEGSYLAARRMDIVNIRITQLIA